jgi:hypothetical protein
MHAEHDALDRSPRKASVTRLNAPRFVRGKDGVS